MRHRSMPGTLAVLTAVATLLLPAAGLAQQPEQDTESGQPQDVIVRVENHNWLDMHVYVVTSGAAARSLGIVTSQTSQVFHLPSTVALAGADLRVIADPIGGRGVYVSDELLATPTTEVVVTLENSLELSYASSRPRSDPE